MITRKICPECGSENVVPVATGDYEQMVCNECGYSGYKFIEEPMLGSKNEEETDDEIDLEDLPKKTTLKKKSKKTKGAK